MTKLTTRPGTTRAGTTRPGTSRPGNSRHRALLLVLAGNMLIDALEVSVLLVALPAIGGDLGLSPWNTQWVMSGFALGFAALLLLGPRITARWGRRRVYLAALLVFVLASAAGGLADGPAVLVLTRVVKGMCAALTAPTGLAIISTAFREGDEQRRAVSVYSLFGAAGFTAGLLASGVLTGLSWRWDLVLPAPAALVLLVFAVRLIPDGRDPGGRDPGGRDPGGSDPGGRDPGGRAALLRNGAFVRSAVCAACLNGTYLGLLLLVTFQLHNERGWNSWQTALALLPACLPLAVSLPHAPRMVARFGTDRLITAGMLAAALGCAVHTLLGTPRAYATGVLPALLLVEAGFVLSFAALNMQATSGIPAARRGRAVPVYQTAVQLGAAAVLPVVAALLGADGTAYRPALLLLTSVSAVSLLVALTGARAGRGAT
ncbi:MFS transporter [Streptomyces sp. NPDC048603]|uniref:MFS transporter n=1 Tax=Streptomyces sp. NPDC048603 TaxID=3365577 RepID=UPI00370FC788